MSLDGKVLGVYGKAGKNLGEFGWIHAIACPSENEIWVGELLNWRVQRLVVKGVSAAAVKGHHKGHEGHRGQIRKGFSFVSIVSFVVKTL